VAKKERKEVTVSDQFTTDLTSVYEYGEEVFGAAAAYPDFSRRNLFFSKAKAK